MTAETSNARGEWVLVPREPSAGMLDSAENAMIESECAYNAGKQDARSDAHGFPTMRIWQAVVAYRAMLAAAPPPAAAGPKTLPVPTHVYLTDKAAVIVGDPQRGWDEEGPEAHNCDAMGCATIGPHVLARVPFTDERAMSQPAEAQAQGGGEVAGWVLGDAFVDAKFWTADTPPQGWTPVYCTAPPSAPVGVERKYPDDGNGDDDAYNRGWNDCLDAIAQQPAAVDEFAADRERLLRAFMMECGIIGAKEAGVNLARGIKAALAAQQQGGRGDAR